MTEAAHDELALLRRLDRLAALLPTLAGALDVREIFSRLSSIAKQVIDHDGMGNVLLDSDRASGKIYAVSAMPAWADRPP